MIRILGTAVLVWALLVPAVAVAGDHVRVVLDLSLSMKKNDPGRLAILSTLLLHDLAAPNSTLDDSFEILPFDHHWQWEDPDDPSPRATRERVRSVFEERTRLVDTLKGLPYDAAMTYFHPGIAAAIEDLRQTPGGDYDVRTIVLVTDGVPEKPTRDKEAELIRRELVPRLEEHGIRLYILAFSAEAEKYRDFLDNMVRGSVGGRLGEVFLDPDGSELLSHMLALFARSFGYLPDTAHDLPGDVTLDLEAGSQAEKVAVVVHTPRSTVPTLALQAPPAGTLNAPDGVVDAKVTGAAYSLVWSLSPDPGSYRLRSDAVIGSVAVLRPAPLELAVLPSEPLVVMAQRPVELDVRVSSPLGTVRDPGPVNLSHRPVGPREEGGYAWRGDREAPPPGSGKTTDEGRLYGITVEFQENRDDPRAVYVGYLEVEARRGDAVVGTLIRHDARRVEVHPLLELAPLPLTSYISESALEERDESCTRFVLEVSAGELPHPDRPEYALRAVLDPAEKKVLQRELNGALFTFDGLPLDFENSTQPELGPWYKGRTLTREDLLDEHELCVRMGKPLWGDPAAPLELPLELSFLETPYDDFDVLTPFTAKVLVGRPGILDRYRTFFVLGAALLALLAALWYSRDRPLLPDDLGYSLGRDSEGFEARSLAPGPRLRQLLGLVVERPLIAAGEDATLGWLRPAGEELYRMRPAADLAVVDEAGRVVDLERGLATLDVHRTYHLRSERGDYRLRLAYR